ncbi:MAG: hypothetical protein GXY83_13600 [Rhodopirellula sp.]|nr:hypothetical protein [Rhodopirellula sp.]
MLNRRDFCRRTAASSLLGGLGGAATGPSSALAQQTSDAGDHAFELRVTRSRKIFSDGRHNAFTGMAQLGDRFYITFRSSEDHVSPEGGIRLIASDNRDDWRSIHLFRQPNADLRDPKLAAFQGSLLCYFAAAPVVDGKRQPRRISMMVRSSDGIAFGEPVALQGIRPGAWLWHVAARGDAIYGSAYWQSEANRYDAALYRSEDGVRWKPIADFPTPSSEIYLDFDPQGVLWALVRNQYPADELVICRADPPYTRLGIHKRIPMPVGGPMIKRLPTGCVMITRHWDPPGRRNLRSEVLWLPDGGEPRSITRLPSGGDTSYAAWLDLSPGLAAVSYYSSHEHKMDTPVGSSHPDPAHAEHSTAADIFLADVSYSVPTPSTQ